MLYGKSVDKTNPATQTQQSIADFVPGDRRRAGRWSALGGRRKSWLAGAWISGLETILPGARAFSPVLTRVANISPSPGRRSVWTSSSQLRSLHVMQAVLNAPVVAEQPEQFLRPALPGTQAGQQIPTLPAHPPRWLGPPSPSPPSPPASPREIPTHPGCSRPVRHRSGCAVSRSRPLFSRVSACGSPGSSPAKPSVNAASTVG